MFGMRHQLSIERLFATRALALLLCPSVDWQPASHPLSLSLCVCDAWTACKYMCECVTQKWPEMESGITVRVRAGAKNQVKSLSNTLPSIEEKRRSCGRRARLKERRDTSFSPSSSDQEKERERKNPAISSSPSATSSLRDFLADSLYVGERKGTVLPVLR